MTPAPMMRTCLLIGRTLTVRANSPAERVFVIEQKRCFTVHKRRASDGWNNLLAHAVIARAKGAADDAFLDPLHAFGEFAIRGEASEFCARSSAARRAVVRFAGAEHEISRVRGRLPRRPKKFDVVHFGKALLVHSLPHTPG